MSPKLLLIALPALLLPLAVIIMLDDDTGPSQVEIALGALPLAGNVPAATDGRQSTQLLGDTRKLPPTSANRLFANSARTEATRFANDTPPADVETPIQDYGAIIANAMHPENGPREDLLAGTARLNDRTLDYDMSVLIFREFCTPENILIDPYALDPDAAAPKMTAALLGNLASYISVTEMARMCPRLKA